MPVLYVERTVYCKDTHNKANSVCTQQSKQINHPINVEKPQYIHTYVFWLTGLLFPLPLLRLEESESGDLLHWYCSKLRNYPFLQSGCPGTAVEHAITNGVTDWLGLGPSSTVSV